MKLDGKIAVVTGAGRGIGRVIALTLANEGAKVVVNYHRAQQGAMQLVEDIHKLGRQAICVQADVSKSHDVDLMLSQTLDSFGTLDILVNNSGTWITAPFLQQTEESWDLSLDTNLKGAFLCSLGAARVMVEKGAGKIVNISSVHDILTVPGFSCAYAASKGGLVMLTKAMALELAPHHINVNAVSPGTIPVEKHIENPDYEPKQWGEMIPWGKVGLPEDIANAVLFLVSEDAGYITGQVLYVDGGLTARLAFQSYLRTH